jgi:hypothetical protein
MAAIVQTQELILEIQDNYQKQSYRNRTYINTANGRLGLTIPVKHKKSIGHKKTINALIENNFLWQRQHWRSIQIAYRSSPFFEYYEDELAILYTKEYKDLQQFNIFAIELLLEMLGLDKKFKLSKTYENPTEYIDLRILASAKMKNRSIIVPEYDQVFAETNEFNAQVSVIDLLFSEGPNAVNYLQKISLEPLL